MAKVRVGVIGAGSWAIASHLPHLAKHDDLEYVGISRKGPEILKKIADRYGFKVASEDYRDVLNAGVDICVIGSPTGLHHEHAKAALEAGAHVMCEKPVTIEPEHAWDLDATAKRLGRELIIAFGWNYMPMMQEAKALMEKYGIGDLEHLTIHMSSMTRELLSNTGAYPDATPESLPDEKTWTDPKLSGGGFGQAQLTHALGMGLWITGARAESGFALMSAPMNAPVEMHDAMMKKIESGVDFTGIICGNDLIALGAIRALREKNIGVPEDVSVIGYDDIDFAGSANVPLTSISQPAYELGFAAAELIISECENPERHVHQRIEFQPRLVVRSSTAPTKSHRANLRIS